MLIRDLVRTINELQGRLQLIMQTIINYSKAEGNFKLSEDLLRLVKIEEKNKPWSKKIWDRILDTNLFSLIFILTFIPKFIPRVWKEEI